MQEAITHEWRERYLTTSLRMLAGVLPVILVLIELSGLPAGGSTLRPALYATAVLFAVGGLFPAIPFNVRILLLLVPLYGLPAFATLTYGRLPGSTAGLFLFVLVVGLFLGKRFAYGAVAAAAGVFVVKGLVIQTYPELPAGAADPALAVTWFRWALMFGVVVAVGVISVYRLIDRLEESVRAYRDELEARHTAESALYQAQQMEVIAHLATGMAHDLGNEAFLIQLVTTKLREKKLEVEEELDSIQAAASQSSELARVLLKLGTSQDISVGGETDVRAMVTELAGVVNRLLPKGIQVELELGEAPSVSVTPTVFRQILFNLVLNARDAMPDGGTITIRTKAVNGQVCVQVQDTGTGMDEATQRQVFDPFFTTKGARGTGLGLATVRGLVDKLGGTISVASEIGVGTTFELLFPAVSTES